MRHAATAALVVLVAAGTGCGSGGSSKPSASATASGPAATEPADERPAVERTVHQLVDRDDCSIMSDRFVGEGYATAAEGRAACESDT